MALLITETNTAVATKATHIIMGYGENSAEMLGKLLGEMAGFTLPPPDTKLPAVTSEETGLVSLIGGGGDPKLTRWLKVQVDRSGKNPKYSRRLIEMAEQAIVVDANNNCLAIRKHRNTDIPIPPMHHLGGLPVFIATQAPYSGR